MAARLPALTVSRASVASLACLRQSDGRSIGNPARRRNRGSLYVSRNQGPQHAASAHRRRSATRGRPWPQSAPHGAPRWRAAAGRLGVVDQPSVRRSRSMASRSARRLSVGWVPRTGGPAPPLAAALLARPGAFTATPPPLVPRDPAYQIPFISGWVPSLTGSHLQCGW